MFHPHVLACAVLCALAGTAGAQSASPAPAGAPSSVTVYGVVDVPVSYGSGSLTSMKSVGNGFGGGLMGSRLGFRGIEDLGGGMKAIFVMEHGLTPDTGGQASPVSFWNRQVYVGVSGGYGEVQLGRVYTPNFTVHGNYDAFGPQGVAAQQVFFGSLESLQPAAIRANNAVNYVTPAGLGGFVLQATAGAGEGNPGGYRGLRVGYDNGSFAVDVAAGRYRQAAMPTGNGPLALGTLNALTVGARYRVGPVTLYGLYDRNDSHVMDSHGLQFSATWAVGALDLKASIAQSSLRTDGGVDRGTTRRVGLGGVYHLSKRTALYTSLAHLSNSNGAAMSLAGSTTAPNHGSSGIDVGIRHLF